MFNPFTWYSEYRLKRLELTLAAQRAPFEMMAQVVEKQAGVLNEWLNQFKVSELPKTTTIRDEDEWREEQLRQLKEQNEGYLPITDELQRQLMGDFHNGEL